MFPLLNLSSVLPKRNVEIIIIRRRRWDNSPCTVWEFRSSDFLVDKIIIPSINIDLYHDGPWLKRTNTAEQKSGEFCRT